MWIDAIVRKYPAYTHDDVFYLEYEFAMLLLMINKDDVDFSRRYSRANEAGRKRNK